MEQKEEPNPLSPDEDRRYMRRALELAARGSGSVSPNPLVGAVLVKKRRIIGEGYHQSYGGTHAEAAALNNAEDPAAGAVLYCNLEPCSHSGSGKHQPPCADRIIREKISRVVIANRDPNPQVSGRGLQRLRKAGIAVTEGVEAEAGARTNKVFFHFMRTGRPYVTLKIAQTLDGQIAAADGTPQTITNPSSRRRVHRMRALSDGILVGAGTIRTDNPRLTVRHGPGKNPRRIILDPQLTTPPEAAVLNPEADGRRSRGKTLIITSRQAAPKQIETLQRAGALIRWAEPSLHESRQTVSQGLDLPQILQIIASEGITSLLVEGGSRIFTSFIRESLFQEAAVFISPRWFGRGTPVLQGLPCRRIQEAFPLEKTTITAFDGDYLLQGYPCSPPEAPCLPA